MVLQRAASTGAKVAVGGKIAVAKAPREPAIVAPPSRKTDFGLPAGNAPEPTKTAKVGPVPRATGAGAGYAGTAGKVGSRVKPVVKAPAKPKPRVVAKAKPAASGKTTKVKATPKAATAKSVARAASANKAKPAVAKAKGAFSVQIGAFGSRANAEKLLAKHKALFSDGRIVPVVSHGKKVYRVVSGAFSTGRQAAQREIVLKHGGFSTFVRKD